MAWNFQFQGVVGDAITALNNVKVTTGPGEQDQWNRVQPHILAELQAMPLGTVVVSSSGKWSANPALSEVYFTVQSAKVLNNSVLVPPNPPPA